ncbi:hypothetical protein ACLB2K_072300 [Fragaria x ananassa]
MTDHKPLKNIMDQRISTPAQHKWVAKLMGYHYSIEYKADKSNIVPDVLSQKLVLMELNEFWQPLLPIQDQRILRIARVGYTTKKYESIRPPGLLQPLPIPAHNWEDISMDFVEGLPKSNGFNAIMVIVDHLSKFTHFVVVTHPFSAADIADTFLRNIFRLHGMPKCIVSDRDPVFVSKLWIAFFKLNDTTLCHSSAYHPQSDGQSEALYGHSPPAIEGYLPGTTTIAAVDKALQDKDILIEHLRTNMAKAQNRMKQMVDKNRTEREFAEGDWVFLKLQPYWQKSLLKRLSTKLAPWFFGPFKILQKIGSVAYCLELPPNSRLHPVFHASLLKKCIGDLALVSGTLPQFDKDGQVVWEPLRVLDMGTRTYRKRRITTWLVQWNGLPVEDATWEDAATMISKFPTFGTCRQAPSRGGSDVGYQHGHSTGPHVFVQ